jgi:peroxiredoxin
MKALLSLLFLSCITWNVAAQKLVDGQLPAFEVQLLDDSIVRSADLDGQVVLLALVRATQPANPKIPCSYSIGLLNLINKEIIDRFPGEKDLLVLPVFARAATRQEVARLRSRYRLDFPVGMDRGGKIASLLAGDNDVHVFVIDREGTIREVPYQRAFTDEERARYKASTGKNPPPTRLSLEAAARVIEDALAVVPAGGIDFQPLTLTDALAIARAGDKQVLAACYLPWYASCQYMFKHVFTRRLVGEYCNARFVCVKFDMEEGDGARLQKRLKLSLTEPTTLLLGPDGKVIYQATGRAPADEWLAGIAGAINE